jgi:hypothetical protein
VHFKRHSTRASNPNLFAVFKHFAIKGESRARRERESQSVCVCFGLGGRLRFAQPKDANMAQQRLKDAGSLYAWLTTDGYVRGRDETAAVLSRKKCRSRRRASSGMSNLFRCQFFLRAFSRTI